MTKLRNNIEDDESLEEVEEVKAKKVRRIVEEEDDEEYEDITTDERIINIEKKSNQIFVISLISLLISLVALLLLLINGTDGLSKNNTTGTNTDSAEPSTSGGYDTSAFKAIKGTDIASESKGELIVVLVARQSCGYCVQFVPTLTAVAEEYGTQIRYIDLETLVDINSGQTLDSASVQAIGALTGEGDWKTFAADNFGYTPQTMFIKDNKVVYGIGGATTIENTRAAFEAAGFKKK